MDTREKILSRPGLHAVLEEHRRAGRRIVFARGVFELLHVGHTRFLSRARAEGDLLAVAVHSDAGVKRLRGEGRPILTERARAILVAAQAAVDYVMVADETDVRGLLSEFQPDVYARGDDGETDAQRDAELRMLGIRVAVLGGDPLHSTTAVIERIRREAHG